jgi:MYM-type Zinc finger with FCS sequence motif
MAELHSNSFSPASPPRLCCWWCCHPWEGPEVHAPFKYDPLRKQFTTKGHFCSFECAKSWIIDKNSVRYGEMLMIMALYRKHVYGKSCPCPPAPKRETLNIFGGPLTIEEFRKCANKAPWVHEPGDIHILHEIDTRSGPAAPAVGTDGLSLVRTKPLKRAESKLEAALKLKKKGSVP